MRLFFSLLLVAIIKTPGMAQLPRVGSGTIQRLEQFPSKYISARNIDVWLPEGYSASNKYAVLYMHDGQMLFDSTTTWNGQEWGVDETMGRLLRMHKIKNCIVVGIWNNGVTRHSDYFPQKPFEALPKTLQDSLLNEKRNGANPLFPVPVRSDQYLQFLVLELKPYIDAHFSTRKDRKHTFIAGSSMGGLISLYAICEYPGIFGGAACLSTHWPGTFSVENNPIPAAFVQYVNTHLPPPSTHRIYFDYGTATLDAWYEPFQRRIDGVMKRHKYKGRHWTTRKFEGADHSERAWRARLEIPLMFLLK